MHPALHCRICGRYCFYLLSRYQYRYQYMEVMSRRENSNSLALFLNGKSLKDGAGFPVNHVFKKYSGTIYEKRPVFLFYLEVDDWGNNKFRGEDTAHRWKNLLLKTASATDLKIHRQAVSPAPQKEPNRRALGSA